MKYLKYFSDIDLLMLKAWLFLYNIGGVYCMEISLNI